MAYENAGYRYQGECCRAAYLYLDRQDGKLQPRGWTGSYRQWRPFALEYHQCCCEYLNLGRRSKTNLKRHCRSLKHVAAVYDLPLADVRSALREIRKGR